VILLIRYTDAAVVVLRVLNSSIECCCAGVQVLVAESYGGRDEPVDTLVGSLVDVNVAPIFDPLRVKAVPTEGTYQARTPSLACPLWSLRCLVYQQSGGMQSCSRIYASCCL
jgi:hypothetical protein